MNPLLHHLVLLLILNYHNWESNCAQPKKTGSAKPILGFLFGGVLVIEGIIYEQFMSTVAGGWATDAGH